MERVSKTRFTFQSEGETLVGDLFLPADGEPAGVLVAVGPLTSVKEQAGGTYAQAMAERGHAALAFDYRYFGESGGQPRQFESPEANIEDIKSAATACARRRSAEGPAPGRSRHLLRRRADGTCGRGGPAVPCLRRRSRCVHRQREDDREDGRRIPGVNRPRPGRRTSLARDRRGGDDPGGRAGRRRCRNAAPGGIRPPSVIRACP